MWLGPLVHWSSKPQVIYPGLVVRKVTLAVLDPKPLVGASVTPDTTVTDASPDAPAWATNQFGSLARVVMPACAVSLDPLQVALTSGTLTYALLSQPTWTVPG